MNWMITLTFMLYFIGNVFCWLDVVRTFPLPARNKNKKNSTHTDTFLSCRKDRHCRPEQFCHRFEKACKACRTEGQMCRRNKMCCRGMECASGVCRKKVPLGRLGALCTKDRDCNYGFCCARQNGQSVCKPLLREGAACSIPDGGRSYFWNHQCPCAYGLKCKNVDKKQTNDLHSLLDDWKNDFDRRCVRTKVT